MAGNASPYANSKMLMAARLFLWTIIVGGVSCFCIITFMRPTVWYITDQDFVYIRNNMTLAFPGDVPVLTTTTTKPDGTVTVVPVGRDAPLWAGNTAFPVTLQWGSVMMCALAVAGLQALTYWPASGPKRTGVLPGTKPSALASAWRLVRRMGATQIPPYRFWSWWCDGLSVFDAMIAAVWLGLAVIYLYYNITRKFAQTGASLTPPPSPPPVPPPPPPSPIDLSLLFNGTANGTGVNGTGVNGTSIKAPAAAAKAAKVVDLMSPLFMSLRLEESAHSFGETLRGLLMVMFIPIARSNFLKHIFGTDFPTIIKYHRWMSWGTLIIAFTHGFLYMIQWGSNASFEEEFSWDTERGRRNVCGLIASIFAVLIAFTSTSWFRATYYHLFHRMHLFSGATFLIFGLMHYKAMANWIYPGLVVYMIDRFGFRMWQMMRNWTRVGPKDVHIDGNMVTMRFSWHAVEGRTIAPGQTVYVRCPSASLFQSHPFSVADVVHGEDGSAHAVVHMVAQGPWTRAVCTKLAAGETLSMQVEGPYTTQLDHYAPSSAHVIMVAGGQGITPLLGLLRHYVSLLAGGAEPSTTVPRVHLLWSSRSLGPLKLLGQDLLQACCRAASGDKSAWLSASMHYTGFELEEQGQSINLPVARKASAGSDEAHSEDHHSSSEDAVANVGGGPAANAVVGGNGVPLRAAPMANPLVYALCTLLGFFGAWAGLLAAAYYDAYKSRTQATGPNYLAVGILQFTCILFGAALPTLAVLAINDVLSRRSAAPAMERQLSGDSEDAAASQADKSTTTTSSPLSSATTSLQVLPGYVLAPLRGPVDGASSKALVRGRPDVPVVLARMAQEQAGQGVDEMDVLVAGHDSLVEDVLRACAEHNLRRAAGVPSLRCKRVAFHS